MTRLLAIIEATTMRGPGLAGNAAVRERMVELRYELVVRGPVATITDWGADGLAVRAAESCEDWQRVAR